MRIGIAALHHETNSFSNIPMDWEYLRKTRFEKETYRLLGAQIGGYEGVDKRIDVIATAKRESVETSGVVTSS